MMNDYGRGYQHGWEDERARMGRLLSVGRNIAFKENDLQSVKRYDALISSLRKPPPRTKRGVRAWLHSIWGN